MVKMTTKSMVGEFVRDSRRKTSAQGFGFTSSNFGTHTDKR